MKALINVCHHFSAALRQACKSHAILIQLLDEMQTQPLEEARRSMQRIAAIVRESNKAIVGQIEMLDLEINKASGEVPKATSDAIRRFLDSA